MPETIQIDNNESIIHIKSVGHISKDEWGATSKSVLEIYEEKGIRLVCVDASEQLSTPSIGEIYEFAKYWNPKVVVAVIAGEATKDDQQFHENAASNRGKTIRVFENREDAMEWLDHYKQKVPR